MTVRELRELLFKIEEMSIIAMLYTFNQLNQQVQEKVKIQYKNDPLHYTQLLYYANGNKYQM